MMIGLISFPPFTNEEYAEVKFKRVVSADPREIDNKGRESIKLWAESNSRLASFYISRKQPEVAVPLLVEIIRLMSPSSTEGKEAYKNLVNIGFVETPYN